MAYGSSALAEPGQVAEPRHSPNSPGVLLLTALWSPLLLLTGLVHVLCRPLTKKILLGLVILDIPLQWGTHLDMTQDISAAMGALNGFDVSITTLALAGLYIGWLFTGRAQGRQTRVIWNWPIAAYTAVVMASLFVASDLQLSLFQAYLMLEMLLLYLYCAANIRSREDVYAVLYVVLAGGIIESAYMLVLAAVGHEFAFLRMLGFKSVIYLPVQTGETARFGGTIGSPNFAAAYLGMVIILAIAIRQMQVPTRLRRLTIPVILLAAPALLVTISRGGMLEVTVSVGIFAAVYWFRLGLSTRRAMALACALGVVLAAIFIPSPLSTRLTGNDNGSAYSRVPLMQLAGHIIAANPVLGVGANNFAAVMRQYEGPEFRYAWEYTVHNEFLLVWAETGVIGFAAYLWIYASLIRRGWRMWTKRDALFAPLGLGIVAAICGLLSHMFFEAFSSRPLIQLVWLLFAVVDACVLIQQNEPDNRSLLQSQPSQMVVVGWSNH